MNNIEELLNELYEYTQLEQEGIKLTSYQTLRYITIYRSLKESNIEIPFSVEI